MTKNLGRDFVYGHESSKPVGAAPRRTVFGASVGALVPLVVMVAAFAIARYFFSF
jgi:hypothetical protein